MRFTVAPRFSIVRLSCSPYVVSIVLPLAVVAPSPLLSQVPLSVDGLRVEFLATPVGTDPARLRLSCRLASTARNTMQAAYQLQVASSEANLTRGTDLLWDSGRILSDVSVLVDYGGPPMVSRTRYYWRVRVWDSSGRASSWSPAAYCETGLLQSQDWTAQWICPAPSAATSPSRPGGHPTAIGCSTRPTTSHRSCDGVKTLSARCSGMAGIAGTWGSSASAACTVGGLPFDCSSRSAIRTAGRNGSSPTRNGRRLPARSSPRTSTEAKRTTRGGSFPDGPLRPTTITPGHPWASSIRRRPLWSPPCPRRSVACASCVRWPSGRRRPARPCSTSARTSPVGRASPSEDRPARPSPSATPRYLTGTVVSTPATYAGPARRTGTFSMARERKSTSRISPSTASAMWPWRGFPIPPIRPRSPASPRPPTSTRPGPP